MKYSLSISLISLKKSLVFPILLFSSISLHWSWRKAFLSLLAILWNCVFKWVYLSFSLLLFASFLFTAICKASSDSHFAFVQVVERIQNKRSLDPTPNYCQETRCKMFSCRHRILCTEKEDSELNNGQRWQSQEAGKISPRKQNLGLIFLNGIIYPTDLRIPMEQWNSHSPAPAFLKAVSIMSILYQSHNCILWGR